MREDSGWRFETFFEGWRLSSTGIGFSQDESAGDGQHQNRVGWNYAKYAESVDRLWKRQWLEKWSMT